MASDLRAELLADPLVPPRGYSTMTDQEAADDLNLREWFWDHHSTCPNSQGANFKGD